MPLETFEDEGLENLPDLRVAQWIFRHQLDITDAQLKKQLRDKILKIVKEEDMVPYYEIIEKELGFKIDAAVITKMAEVNAKKLKEIDAKVVDAESNLGETEVREAMIEKAHYYSRIGSKDGAMGQFNKILEKTLMPGLRLNIIFHIIRIGFFYNDRDLITKNIEKANSLIEEGGDWDRRNRLKVYRGLYSLSVRDFKAASKQFLDAVATFTSYELMDYKTFIVYTVITAMISLTRPELREQVIRGSEVQAVLHSLPSLRELLMSLFECRYAEFFLSLAGMEQYMLADRYLSAHARYFAREMRLRAYQQQLDSYRSLSLSSMCSAFGVTSGFLDTELSRFIAAGRLPAKIDKVAGVIETTRPDNVNFQYQSMIKHGDVFLNRVQKLSQVINI